MRKTLVDPRQLPEIGCATLVRIASQLIPYRRRAATGRSAYKASAPLNLVPAILEKRIVDVAIPARDIEAIVWLSIGMVAGPLAAGLIGVVERYHAAWIGERVMLDLRIALM